MVTAVVCYFVEGETISRWDVVGIVSSLTGVVVIYNPWKKYDDKDYDYSVGILLAIATAIVAGSNMSVLRYMKSDIHYTRGPLFFYSGGMLFSPILHFFSKSKQDQSLSVYDKKTLILITATIVCSFFGHIFQSRSYQLEKGARISMVFQLSIVFAFMFDIVLFNTSFSWREIIGSLMIVGTFFLISLLKFKGYMY